MRRLRSGFTLVELLVVIAIIAILVLLLLPAINALRESARRTQCINRMSQLIVGVHNHEMAHGDYPMGVRSPSGPIVNQEQGLHHSWTIPVLPFVEEDNVYRIIDHEKSVYAKSNRPARDTHLATFICPSSPMMSDGIGHSNYAAVHHDIEAPINDDNNGVFFLNSRISHDEVTDGTQYTFFLGEKILERGDLGWMSGTRATLRNTGTRLNTTDLPARGRTGLSGEFLDEYESRSAYAEFEEVADFEEGDEPAQDESDEGGADEDEPVPEESQEDESQEEEPSQDDQESQPDVQQQDAVADEAQPAETTTDKPAPTDDGDPWAAAKQKGLFVGGFGSFHKGGSVFAFGDGHIRFIDNGIDFQVFQSMGGRADGKVINARVLD